MQQPETMEMLKTRIDRMSKAQHIEILRILRKNSEVKLNENKSGVFINLSFLPEDIVGAIQEYVKYVDDQEMAINSLETQKEVFKNAYF
jgi:hypothetical protein